MNEKKQDGWAKLTAELKDRVILTVGGVRSGTTVFRAMLASHPQIVDRGEVFNANNKLGYFRFLLEQARENPELILPDRSEMVFRKYLYSLVPKDPKAMALVDVKYEHLPLLPDAWQLPFSNPALLRLLKRSQLRALHLRRKNFFSVMSNLLAVSSGRYHDRVGQADAKSGPVEREPIEVSRSQLMGSIKRRKRTVDLVDQTLVPPQCLAVDYESVFDDEGAFGRDVIDAVAQHLGLDPAGFQRVPALRKVVDKPMSTLVSNFAEIADLQDE